MEKSSHFDFFLIIIAKKKYLNSLIFFLTNSLSKKIKNKIILLFGPTASGKSKLSIDIAKELKCEIVNADSMQIYKEVKILSARPNNNNIKHHLYGFVSVKKNFSTGSWYKIAAKKIQNIKKKRKNTISCWWNWFIF